MISLVLTASAVIKEWIYICFNFVLRLFCRMQNRSIVGESNSPTRSVGWLVDPWVVDWILHVWGAHTVSSSCSSNRSSSGCSIVKFR